jgi:2-polyprenyl-3-methyl-5-hydroxy-6-metoxy-1,4-benzoquinol methylase
MECQGCGLAYLHPRVRSENLEKLYPPGYYGMGTQRFRWGLEKAVTFFRRRRAQRVARITPPGRLLDVGCGRGIFLSILRENGWEVFGTELSDQAAREARERFGLNVLVGALPSLGLPERTFDVVTLWHVLEHLPDPLPTLREIRRVMRDDGWVILALPNLASWQAKLTRGYWYHLDPPRHYYFYTPRTLEKMLHHIGFRTVRVRHLSLEHNFHALFHSLFNLLGFSRNLTYEALRASGAKRTKGMASGRKPQVLAAALLALPVACFTVIACALESLLRKGGTIEVYARKAPAGCGEDTLRAWEAA